MRRSKLEKYIEILEALVTKPLELEAIAFNTQIECRALKRHLNFLRNHQLVEEHSTENPILYATNDRGLSIIKALKAQAYFGKLQKVLARRSWQS